MKKIWDFILKFRLYILIGILVIFAVFVGITMKAYLDPEDETTVYGNRLDGIENVPITESFKKELIDFIKEDEDITDVIINVKGKIINIYIKVDKEENTIKDMQEKADEIIKKFSDKEIAFYDFQIFIKNVDANYNMIGYKNNDNETISWVSDEIEKSEVEVNEEEQ